MHLLRKKNLLSMHKTEKIEIIEYSENYRNQWDEFVLNSNNGTMFHKQSFLDYHQAGKFDFYHLLFIQNGRIIGLLPGGITDSGKVFWSPLGASYGGIVAEDVPFRLALQMIDTLLEFSYKKSISELYLIPPPIIYNKVFNQHFEYAMLYRRFDFEYHYISHAIDLSDGIYFDKFDIKTQRIINKILKDKNLTIRESKDFEAFYPILLKNKAKHKSKPTHSLNDLKVLNELIPEDLKLYMIYYGDTPIAGSLLFLTNPKVALCFYIMMEYDYKHLKPTFLGIQESCRWAYENGYQWLDIGVSQDTTSDDPMTPSDSLIYFKERFHARGLLRTTYHYKFK